MKNLNVIAEYISLKMGFAYNERFIEEIQANKRKFYSNDEKTRNTKFKQLIIMESKLKVVLEGFKYQKYIRNNNISIERSRVFI